MGIIFPVVDSTNSTDRYASFDNNWSFDNQHIFSIPTIKESQITQTHALWVLSIPWVLVICINAWSNVLIRLTELHSDGIVNFSNGNLISFYQMVG